MCSPQTIRWVLDTVGPSASAVDMKEFDKKIVVQVLILIQDNKITEFKGNENTDLTELEKHTF
jgi:hypothetical protein